MNHENTTGLRLSLHTLGLASLFSAVAACGAAAGTGPHEMSAAQHQQSAAAEAAQGTSHAEQYDPDARKRSNRCETGQASKKGVVCWRELVNPTQEHDDQAEQHRELAAKHRAASQALVSAEKQACEGLEEEDRDTSPFAHAGDIQSVSQLRGEVLTSGGPTPSGYAGATIVFRAVPGLTAPWLQRIIDCHLARNAAIGHAEASSEMAYCPLTLDGVRASVREQGAGFAVDVRSENSTVAQEIWKRAQKLAPSGG